MKTKRFILCLLLICFIFAFIPDNQAHASGNIHVHPRVTFEIPIGSEDALAVGGDAYLTSDITLTSDVVISESLSLCLNGYNINMGSHSITIAESGSLAIHVCPDTLAGGFIVGSGEKAAIEVYGSFTVLGGNFVTDGRPIIFNKAETNLSGGTFTGPDAQLVQTSGSGVLAIYGGELVASGSGSAVAMIAAAEDETAQPQDFNAVIVGGVVDAGEGSPGTVLINAPKGRFVINSGANITGSGCPAIKVENGSFDAYGGAVVYSDTESAIVGTGGKIGLYFANITSDEKYGVDISEDAQLLLSGSLEIVGGNAGIRLAEGKVFSMSDYGFYGDVRVSIHTDVTPTQDNPVPISTPCEAKHYSHFLSATPSASITYKDRVIYNSYDGSVSHSHEGRNYVLALNGGYTDLSKNNFYLEDDLSCNGFYTGSVVNICLNGHTLTLGNAIKMYPNSTLNIYDCQGGGKIQSNYNCIQDINNGSARLIVHQGTIVSNGSAPIKLTGGDSVIVKGGQIMSVLEGSCAIEAGGNGNSVTVDGGSIEGVAAAIRVQDGEVSIDGKPEGTIKGNYIVDCTGFDVGLVTVDGNVKLESATADIHLAANKLVAAGAELDPSAKVSLATEAVGDVIVLSAASDRDISPYFESVDTEKALMCGQENILQLVRSLPASPESAEIGVGESTEFKVDYSGEGTAVYQWYIRDTETQLTEELKGANDAVLSTPADIESGKYELYCMVSDETGTYVGATLALKVNKDVIENVSVAAASDYDYSGEPVTPEVNASASTTMGRSVSFRYSVDGVNYADAVPVIGPDFGEYTIYYIASAEGCDDVMGQFSVVINEAEQVQLPDAPLQFDFSPRFMVIIASTIILFVLCIIFAIQLIRKKTDE